MIKAEAFLAIESSLSDKFAKELALLTKDIYSKVGRAISNGEFVEAVELVRDISFQPMFDKLKDYLTYHTHIAMLFGASRVTHTPGTSVVGLGFEKDTVSTIVENFRVTIADAEAYVREQAVQLIALHRESARPEAPLPVEVQKAERILQPFESFMDETGKAYFNLVSSLHTSRVSAYGFTAEANVLGLEYYEINEQLDNRICPVCRIMHKKVFQVRDARKLLTVVTRTTDKELLKNLQPWPKQTKESLKEIAAMTADELVAKGWHVPPFHPRCRGLLGRVGKSPALPAQGQPSTKVTDHTATIPEFEGLGLKVTPKNVAHWNKFVKQPPAEVVSAVAHKPVSEVLAVAETEKTVIKPQVIDSFKITTKALTITSSSDTGHGAATRTITAKFKEQELAVESAALNLEKSKVSVAILQKAYLLAKDIGMKKMITAVSGKGSVSLAAMGFSPLAADSWAALKAAISQRFSSIEAKLSLEGRQAVESILSSDNPESIIELALLGKDQSGIEVGKTLLTGLEWEGGLDFNSTKSMEAFLSSLIS